MYVEKQMSFVGCVCWCARLDGSVERSIHVLACGCVWVCQSNELREEKLSMERELEELRLRFRQTEAGAQVGTITKIDRHTGIYTNRHIQTLIRGLHRAGCCADGLLSMCVVRFV